MEIILYTPGSCGNLISAMIDDTGYYFDGKHFEASPDRIFLRNQKYMSSMTDVSRDTYVKLMASKYKSLPSHAYEYHINRKHKYIFVSAFTDDEVSWAINRFKTIHPTFPIKNDLFDRYYSGFMQEGLKHTDRVISLTDIWSGNLVDKLKQYIHTPLNEKIYYDWLKSEVNTNVVS